MVSGKCSTIHPPLLGVPKQIQNMIFFSRRIHRLRREGSRCLVLHALETYQTFTLDLGMVKLYGSPSDKDTISQKGQREAKMPWLRPFLAFRQWRLEGDPTLAW
jgi:hypothetical protein